MSRCGDRQQRKRGRGRRHSDAASRHEPGEQDEHNGGHAGEARKAPHQVIADGGSRQPARGVGGVRQRGDRGRCGRDGAEVHRDRTRSPAKPPAVRRIRRHQPRRTPTATQEGVEQQRAHKQEQGRVHGGARKHA
jgi:hypothetical protein